MSIKKFYIYVFLLCCAVIHAQNPLSGQHERPYSITVTFYDSSKDQYGINWHSETAYTKPQIQFAKTVNGEQGTVDDVSCYARSEYYVYKGILTGLEPGTKYLYRVGNEDSDVWSEWGSFETQAGNKSAFTFFHISDTQGSQGVWSDVLKTSFKTYEDVKFILHTGDLVGNGSNISEWQYAFSVTEETLRQTLITSVAGTQHENFGTELYDHFNIHFPNGQDPTYGFYYSYDYNDAHFTMIDVGTHNRLRFGGDLYEDQLEWLKKDLAGTDKKWKIVGIHWSLYGSGPWTIIDETVRVKKQLIPIFDEYGVHLVLSGHDHVYTRSHQMRNDKVTGNDCSEMDGNIDFAVNPHGTIYVSINPAGGPILMRQPNNADKSHAAVYGQPNLPMFGAITIDGNKLVYKAYTVNEGEAILYDSFGIKSDGTDKSIF